MKTKTKVWTTAPASDRRECSFRMQHHTRHAHWVCQRGDKQKQKCKAMAGNICSDKHINARVLHLPRQCRGPAATPSDNRTARRPHAPQPTQIANDGSGHTNKKQKKQASVGCAAYCQHNAPRSHGTPLVPGRRPGN